MAPLRGEGGLKAGSVRGVATPPEIPPLLDEQVLANLHEDFASTDDLDELASLIRNFVARGEEGVGAAAAAVKGGEREAIRQAAHKLKGSSRTLGALLLGAVAGKVEAAAAEGDLAVAERGSRELEVVFGLTRHALVDMAEAIGGDGSRSAAAAQPAVQPLRALLVDDEPIALAVLRATAERLGHESVVATDGEAAFALYESERPHVVITDLWMPGIDGLELSRRIRALDGPMPYVAVLSASADDALAELGETIDASLTKPLREDELRAVFGLAAQRGP